MIRTKSLRLSRLYKVRSFLLILFILVVSFPAAGVEHATTFHSLLVETELLEQNLNQPSVQVVEIGRSVGDYRNGHIPGAVYFDRTFVWETVDGIPGMLPEVNKVVDALKEAGISDTETVVIYDAGNALWASRLFWALEYLGHTDVHVLEGGWNRWIKEQSRILRRRPGTQRFLAFAPVFRCRIHT